MASATAAARRDLPLALARQALAAPRRVGLGVGERDVDDGMVGAARRDPSPDPRAHATTRRARSATTATDRGGRPAPRVIAKTAEPAAGGIGKPGALRERHVAGRRDERREGPVGDGRRVDPKRRDLDVARRALLRVVLVGADAIAAGRDRHHRTVRPASRSDPNADRVDEAHGLERRRRRRVDVDRDLDDRALERVRPFVERRDAGSRDRRRARSRRTRSRRARARRCARRPCDRRRRARPFRRRAAPSSSARSGR